MQQRLSPFLKSIGKHTLTGVYFKVGNPSKDPNSQAFHWLAFSIFADLVHNSLSPGGDF